MTDHTLTYVYCIVGAMTARTALTVLTTKKDVQELRETDIVSAMTASTALTVLTTKKDV